MQIDFLTLDVVALLDSSCTQAGLKHFNLIVQFLLLLFHFDFKLLPTHEFLGLLHVAVGKIVDPKVQRSIGLRLVRINNQRKI